MAGRCREAERSAIIRPSPEQSFRAENRSVPSCRADRCLRGPPYDPRMKKNERARVRSAPLLVLRRARRRLRRAASARSPLADPHREARRVRDRRQGARRSRRVVAALRSRRRRVPDSRRAARRESVDVAQRERRRVAEPLGRRRRFSEHLLAARLPRVSLGRPARRPRATGAASPRRTSPEIGRDQANFAAWRFGVAYPELVRRRAVPEGRRRGLEPGDARALSRVRHDRECAARDRRRGRCSRTRSARPSR